MKRAQKASARAARQSADAFAMAAAMPLAAMTTLSHRLPMLADAAVDSEAWDDAEFRRMAEEKMQAVGQAALSMGGALALGQQTIADYATAQAKANLDLLTRLPAGPMDALAFGSASFVRLARLTAALGDIGSRGVATGLRPAHRKVTANARRLARRKTKPRS